MVGPTGIAGFAVSPVVFTRLAPRSTTRSESLAAGLAKEAPHQLHLARPDWRHHIIANSRTAILATLSTIWDRQGVAPLVVAGQDMVAFASDEPDPIKAWPGDPAKVGPKIGQYKPIGYAELAQWGRAHLDTRRPMWLHENAITNALQPPPRTSPMSQPPDQPELPLNDQRVTPPAAPAGGPGSDFTDLDKHAEAIWASAVPPPARPATPRAMIAQLYGRGTRGALNTNAAARELGVSQRTVQRWVQARRLPTKSPAGEQLRTKHQQRQNSPQGRKSALGRKNRDRLLGARHINFMGHVKISGDLRRRPVTVDVTQTQMETLITNLETIIDQDSLDALEDIFGAAFGGSVALAIESLGFE